MLPRLPHWRKSRLLADSPPSSIFAFSCPRDSAGLLFRLHQTRGRTNNKTLDGWLKKTQAPYRIEVTSKPPDEEGFVPLKIRWVVEQSIACVNRYRRLSKDYEYTTCSSENWIRISAIQRMLRRLKPDPNYRQAEFKYPRPEKKEAA
jgi:Transposase DDE domain